MMPAIAVLIVLAFVFAVPICVGLSMLLFGAPEYFSGILMGAIILAMTIGGCMARRHR